MLERFRQLKQLDEEENLIAIHDELMRNYGYISIEELKKIPIPTVLEMLEQIRKYKERINKAMRKR
jgi:lipid A disaccharide synthetase